MPNAGCHVAERSRTNGEVCPGPDVAIGLQGRKYATPLSQSRQLGVDLQEVLGQVARMLRAAYGDGMQELFGRKGGGGVSACRWTLDALKLPGRIEEKSGGATQPPLQVSKETIVKRGEWAGKPVRGEDNP